MKEWQNKVIVNVIVSKDVAKKEANNKTSKVGDEGDKVVL